jgi:hypothetical protein
MVGPLVLELPQNNGAIERRNLGQSETRLDDCVVSRRRAPKNAKECKTNGSRRD